MPRLDRIAALYLMRPLVRFLEPRAGVRIPILMYHSISDNLFGISHPYYHINTLPAVFSSQMRWLRSAGYRTIGVAEAWAGLKAGANLSRSVVLAFGDGYRDFYTEAMEVLTQCGFTATIFLVTDRIGQESLRVEGAEYLTWREVKELQKAGIQFGSHTVTHADLRCASLEQMEYELGHSKETIEQQLGVAVDSFSYPFAFPEEDKHFTRFLEDVLQNMGFDYGISTILGRANRNSNRYFLPRLPVNTGDDTSLLRAKVQGGYDLMHWAQLLKKSMLHNPSLMQDATRQRRMKPAH